VTEPQTEVPTTAALPEPAAESAKEARAAEKQAIAPATQPPILPTVVNQSSPAAAEKPGNETAKIAPEETGSTEPASAETAKSEAPSADTPPKSAVPMIPAAAAAAAAAAMRSKAEAENQAAQRAEASAPAEAKTEPEPAPAKEPEPKSETKSFSIPGLVVVH
jgi:hypothetical protein